MNREERRRAERQQRHSDAPRGDGIRETREVAPERAGAEVQDFMAGAIFAAGATGVTAEMSGELDQDVFVVLIDDKAVRVEPRIRDLFDVLDTVGAQSLHQQLKGRVKWHVFNGPAPAAKLVVALDEPVKLHASFLLIPDNYKAIWPAVTRPGHLLGLAFADRVGPATDLHDLLQKSVLFGPGTPSAAVKGMIELQGWDDLGPPPSVMVVTVDEDGSEDDDAEFSLGVMNPAGTASEDEKVAWAVWQPVGTKVSILDGSTEKDGWVEHWIGQGLRRGLLDELVDSHGLTPGWTITLSVEAESFEIRSPNGEVALSGSYAEGADEWLGALTRQDGCVVATGRVRADDGTMTFESLLGASDAGLLAFGFAILTGERVQGPKAADVPQPPASPWWKVWR